MDSAHGEDSNGTLFSAQLSLFGRDDISSSDYKGDGLPAYPGQYWDDEDLLDVAEGAPKHDTNVEIRAPPLLTPATEREPPPARPAFQQIVNCLKECTQEELEILEESAQLRIVPTGTHETPRDTRKEDESRTWDIETSTLAEMEPDDSMCRSTTMIGQSEIGEEQEKQEMATVQGPPPPERPRGDRDTEGWDSAERNQAQQLRVIQDSHEVEVHVPEFHITEIPVQKQIVIEKPQFEIDERSITTPVKAESHEVNVEEQTKTTQVMVTGHKVEVTEDTKVSTASVMSHALNVMQETVTTQVPVVAHDVNVQKELKHTTVPVVGHDVKVVSDTVTSEAHITNHDVQPVITTLETQVPVQGHRSIPAPEVLTTQITVQGHAVEVQEETQRTYAVVQHHEVEVMRQEVKTPVILKTPEIAVELIKEPRVVEITVPEPRFMFRHQPYIIDMDPPLHHPLKAPRGTSSPRQGATNPRVRGLPLMMPSQMRRRYAPTRRRNVIASLIRCW